MATKIFPVGDSLYTEKFNYFTLSTNNSGTTYQQLILDRLNVNLATWKDDLWKVMLAKWYNFEITGATEDEELTFITTIIDMFDSYYKERLTAYKKEFDFETAILLTDSKTTTVTDNATSAIDNSSGSHNTGDGTTHSANSTSGSSTETETPTLMHDNITLPNKVTSAEYVTSRIKDSGTDVTGTTATNTGSEDGTAHNETVGTSTSNTDITDTRNKSSTDAETITDKSKYLEQKKKYLDLLENIYLEFADRFSDCFMHIFS